jgi:hypothetical protein
MAKNWDPRAKAPAAGTGESLEWFAKDVAAFQQTRPDLPQGELGSLSVRAKSRIVRPWNEAREVAELEDAKRVSSEYYDAVKKFQRTRTIMSPPRKGRQTKRAEKNQSETRRFVTWKIWNWIVMDSGFRLTDWNNDAFFGNDSEGPVIRVKPGIPGINA